MGKCGGGVEKIAYDVKESEVCFGTGRVGGVMYVRPLHSVRTDWGR